jgi:hypothetical protein
MKMAKKWICHLRLHWLFDHGVVRNDLTDDWKCKHCGLPVEVWPRRRAKPLTLLGNWTHKVARSFAEARSAFVSEYNAEWHK